MTAEVEITLSGGRKAKIKTLNALETIQAVSFAGEKPSEKVIDLVTAVCSVTELDGERVTPCATRMQFIALSQKLAQIDPILIGAKLAEMMLDGVTEDQKNFLEKVASELGAEGTSTSGATGDS